MCTISRAAHAQQERDINHVASSLASVGVAQAQPRCLCGRARENPFFGFLSLPVREAHSGFRWASFNSLPCCWLVWANVYCGLISLRMLFCLLLLGY